MVASSSRWRSRTALGGRGALIGLDPHQTIGLRPATPDRRIAAAWNCRPQTFSIDAARLLALRRNAAAIGFVLGLPINMDGSEGPRAAIDPGVPRNLAK